MTYTVVLQREDDGRYSVFVPALRGCNTWGHTIAHALEMAHEAICAHVGVLVEDGEAIPEDTPQVTLDMEETSEALVCKVTVAEVVPVG
jgi:predicted RNase H-like HicB family nuclease